MWKEIFKNRLKLKKFFWWKPKSGTSTFLYDNGSNISHLYLKHSYVKTCHSLWDVGCFINEEEWDFEKLDETVPQNMVDHVKTNMNCVKTENKADKPWYIKINNGKFTIKSAWKIPRQRTDEIKDRRLSGVKKSFQDIFS